MLKLNLFSRFIKIIDGHLPFAIKKVLVINLNLTGKFFWSSVLHFFENREFIDKLKLYGKDVQEIGNHIDEKTLNIQFSSENANNGKSLEIDFKQDFASKVFNFYGYRYEDQD